MIAFILALLVAGTSYRFLGNVPWIPIGCMAAVLLVSPLAFFVLLLLGAAAILLHHRH